MNRKGLLQSIAETGYNVGFGAKKNFATHDIVQKAPGLIGFISLAVGVFALIYEPLNSKWIAAALVVLGVAGLYVTHYDHNKVSYSEEGERLTALFYRLRDLYRDVQGADESDNLDVYRQQLEALETELVSSNLSKQILFSDWYAHYKFFWQHQIEWIDEEKHFKFWRDKMPLSFMVSVASFMLLLLGVYVLRCM
ncbi:SLATT domain-containing protein [Pleomorphomonas sp. NRK KF1]|uniref:SLATT domain-containing protein n=1 Tax=Pleomorphomonas sp. NRK KF1 TaxID=2943000 RepID=UPI0020438791|nr:SLATT domain-containing protein [Pleomorphomonas sp. NRK KF1]MCM5553342.1 SLATT domain-containing protein [Pleomorphomonas sp. NRK KF1]